MPVAEALISNLTLDELTAAFREQEVGEAYLFERGLPK